LSRFATDNRDDRLGESVVYRWHSRCSPRKPDVPMVLKIERVSEGPISVLRLCGQLQSSQVQEVKAEMDGQRVAFDLEQVRLVDLDGVHFLAVCEAEGIELRNCPAFIREWVRSEKPRISELE
jgi:hypothetical protein